MLNFIDFEVFRYDWTATIINPIDKSFHQIVNDIEKLEAHYNDRKNEIYIGHNIRSYDQFIFKSILCGFDPKEVNDFIIVKKRKGWEYSNLFQKIPLIFYDTMPSPPVSLKTLEAFMGNDIRETTVDFNIDRKLTPEEIKEVLLYNRHDVEQDIEVFLHNKNEFDAVMGLIKGFKLPLSNLSKTKAQISATVINCRKGASRNDEWDLHFVPTLRLKKYAHVLEWFKNPQNHDYKKALETTICGVPHVFAWGGLHGAPDEPIHRKGLILHVDVNSFYPSIMIEYDLLTRNSSTPEKFKEVYDTRLRLKAEGKKAEQAPLKIVLNATYGITKDKYSQAYDPRQANNICVNGQLLLLDLLEHLEGHCEILQSNTDGLIIQIPDTDEAFEKIDDICYEWEQRTRMGLGLDIIDEIWQKDVNNYIFHFADIEENGKNRNKYERKGGYVKELSELDYDLPIVNKAVFEYITKGIPVETTVNGETMLKEFQKVVKVSDKYAAGWHNGKVLNDKTFRVFSSANSNDTLIGKVKSLEAGTVVEKFANTPDRCFIQNDNVNGIEVDERLDKKWYINEAKKRLYDFGRKETGYEKKVKKQMTKYRI